LRLLAFGGDPLGLFGYSQVGRLQLMQIADVTGVHGITFLIVAVNAAVAEVISSTRERASRGPAAAGLGLATVLVLGAMGYGVMRLATPLAAVGRPRDVGVVQAHLPMGSQLMRSSYGRTLETYLQLSLEVLQTGRPALLVWPENAMTFFLAVEPTYRASIGSVLRPFGAELVAGGPTASPGGEPPYRNSAFVLSPDGEIHGRYDKQRLLPFAEYFPLGSIDILRRHFGRVREFIPGDAEATLLDTAV